MSDTSPQHPSIATLRECARTALDLVRILRSLDIRSHGATLAETAIIELARHYNSDRPDLPGSIGNTVREFGSARPCPPFRYYCGWSRTVETYHEAINLAVREIVEHFRLAELWAGDLQTSGIARDAGPIADAILDRLEQAATNLLDELNDVTPPSELDDAGQTSRPADPLCNDELATIEPPQFPTRNPGDGSLVSEPSQTGKLWTGRKAEILTTMRARGWTSPETAVSRTTIATAMERGSTAGTFSRQFGLLKAAKLITATGHGADSGTYLTANGVKVADDLLKSERKTT